MYDTVYIITEIMIFILSTGAVLLLNLNNKYSRYGVFFGLIAQPFWFLSSYNSGSWGVFAVTFIYTFAYIMGVYNFWMRVQRKNKIKRIK